MTRKPISIEDAQKLNEQERSELMRRIEQDARRNEVEYFGCSQAVLGALQRNLALGDGGAFKAASAFLGFVPAIRLVFPLQLALPVGLLDQVGRPGQTSNQTSLP